MIVVRNIFQAKYGRGDEVAALFAELNTIAGDSVPHQRVLTDLSGTFFTVVTELQVENMAAWEQLQAKVFADERFGPWFSRTMPLIKSGRREFFHIVS